MREAEEAPAHATAGQDGLGASGILRYDRAPLGAACERELVSHRTGLAWRHQLHVGLDPGSNEPATTELPPRTDPAAWTGTNAAGSRHRAGRPTRLT